MSPTAPALPSDRQLFAAVDQVLRRSHIDATSPVDWQLSNPAGQGSGK